MLKMLIALTCLTLSIGASAAQIVYTLNDVVFDDGTTASGTFTYDTDPGPGIDSPGDIRNFVNINITTINGKFLGDSYTGYSRGDDTAGFSGDFAFVGDAQGNVLIFDITGVISDLDFGTGQLVLPPPLLEPVPMLLINGRLDTAKPWNGGINSEGTEVSSVQL